MDPLQLLLSNGFKFVGYDEKLDFIAYYQLMKDPLYDILHDHCSTTVEAKKSVGWEVVPQMYMWGHFFVITMVCGSARAVLCSPYTIL